MVGYDKDAFQFSEDKKYFELLDKFGKDHQHDSDEKNFIDTHK